MRLVAAEGELLQRVLDDTFPLWNDGLSRERYGAYNTAQLKTPWGSRHLDRVALMDGDRLLASAKRYRITLWMDGAGVPVLGIGAVFTSPAERRRGHAAALLEELLRQAEAEGARAAVLFSEIGTPYYERLGFVPLPALDMDVTILAGRGAPAVPIRAVEPHDLPELVKLQAALASRYRVSFEWDADWLAYSLAKKRMLAAFAPASNRLVDCFVAEEGGRAVAWVLLQVSGRDRAGYREGWSIEAAGDRDPSGARIGAILQALLARAPSAPAPVVRAWWPDNLRPPQLALQPRTNSPIVMMMRPLAPGISPQSFARGDILYWHGDAF
jgi:GNAT superfamily N-acetyltransferase